MKILKLLVLHYNDLGRDYLYETTHQQHDHGTVKLLRRFWFYVVLITDRLMKGW